MHRLPSSTIDNCFRKHFGTSVRTYWDFQTGFDIIKFDDDMQTKFGYIEDGKTSLSDFIKTKFGQNVHNTVKNLLNGDNHESR